jgi:hypothetical protein
MTTYVKIFAINAEVALALPLNLSSFLQMKQILIQLTKKLHFL